MLDGQERTVERAEPHFGRVVLLDDAGRRFPTTMRFLMNHPDCRASSTAGEVAAGLGRQQPTLADLTEHQRVVTLRLAHLLEAETGFRGGDPLRPGPGELRPEFDPSVTTLTQRRLAKAAELAGMDREQARLLGLDKAGYRTLIRWAARRRQVAAVGCADDRWLRPGGGHPSVNEMVREAIFAVHAETLHRSRMSLRAKERQIHQYVRELHGPDATAQIPGYYTLRTVWADWFGPGSGQHVVIHRPGQVVAMDTTILPVKVRETVFGDPVSVHLTLALDVYTRSLVAFRLTLVSDSSIDVAMVLRDIMKPLPMRPDWGDDLEWPYPRGAGERGRRVRRAPGRRVAVLRAGDGHHRSRIGLSQPSSGRGRAGDRREHPARAGAAPDRQAAVERAFGSIRSLLFEVLLGYSGVDVYDRGASAARRHPWTWSNTIRQAHERPAVCACRKPTDVHGWVGR